MAKIFTSLWQVLACLVAAISQVHTESIPLTVVTSLATSFSIDPSQSPEICFLYHPKELHINPKFAVKTRDDLTWFEVIQEHQKPSIVRIEETPRSQTTQDVLVSESLQCWQTKRESVRGEDRWVSESTDSKGKNSLLLHCRDDLCSIENQNLNSVEKEAQIKLQSVGLQSFAKINSNQVIFVRKEQEYGDFVLELVERITDNPRMLSRKRLLPQAQMNGQVVAGGNQLVLTLSCGNTRVQDCMTECAGQPYALFRQADGECTDCSADGMIRWDDTMTCQLCDAANNGVTIGHFWDGGVCRNCNPSCKTCIGPDAGMCSRCWDDTDISYISTKTLLDQAGYTFSRRILAGVNCVVMAGSSPCQESPNSMPSLCTIPVSGRIMRQNRSFTCAAGDTETYLYQNNEICGVCPTHCQNCPNKFTCPMCAGGTPVFSVITSTCVATCEDGYFRGQNGNVCQECHITCATCNGPGPAHCLTCNSSMGTLVRLSAVVADTPPYSCINTGCPNGTTHWTWQDNDLCRHCHASCKSCYGSGPNACSSCPASNYLYSSDNHCGLCNELGKTIQDSFSCVDCQSPCATCQPYQSWESQICLSCTMASGLYFNSSGSGNKCESCPSTGTYISDPTNRICGQCTSYCNACNGGGSNDCTLCDTSMMPYGLSGTAPNSCVLCQESDNKYIDSSDHVCKTCPSGQYVSAGVCQTCPTGCETCGYMGYCSTCLPGYTFNGMYCDANSCSPGYYYNTSTTDCQSCSTYNSYCNACTEAEVCTTCDPAYVLTNGHCCAANQFWDGSSCQACSSPCETCSTSASSCLSCVNGYWYNGAGSCTACSGGQVWSSANGGTCQSCTVSHCQACSGDVNQCTQCSSGYGLASSTSCTLCASNQISDGTYPCTQCNTGCATCTTSTSYCTSCETNYGFSSNTCTQCTPGTYWVGATSSCATCDSACATCSSTNTNCQSCNYPYVLTGSTCSNTCVTGQYWVPANGGSCASCVAPCVDCLSPGGPGNCAQCQSGGPGYYVSVGNCYACASNQYSDGWVCSNCDSTCATCNGPSPTPCTSCSNGHGYDSGVCTTCASNEYWVSASSGSCINCGSHCLACSGPTACTQCDPGFYPSGGTCVACQTNQYSNGITCSNCDPSCATCSGGLSTDCLSCPGGSNYNSGTHTCTVCLTNEFWGGSICQACDPTCATCNGPSPTPCTSCSNGYSYNSGVCTACASNEYWVSTSSGSCINCGSHCLTCSGPTACTQCDPGFYPSGGTCVACQTNQYSNGITCSNCDLSCATCSGGLPTECLSCPPGSLYDSNANTCTGCLSTEFWDGSSCQACSSPCETCSGSATHCLSCIANNALTSNTCAPCTGNTYFVSTTTPCSACSTTCTACTVSANACSACIAGHGLAGGSAPAACVPCLANQFKNGEVCANCGTNCATCSSVPACNTCTPGNTLHENSSCSPCQVDNGFFLDGSICRVCQPSPNCKRCSSTSTCLECFNPYNLLTGNICQECNVGLDLYYNPITLNCGPVQYCASYSTQCNQCLPTYFLASPTSCVQCPTNCDTCSSSTVCTACQGSYKLYPQGGNVDCDLCTSNGKFVNAGGQCADCDNSCGTCSGTSTSCLTCNTGSGYKMVVGTNQCVLSCPDGYFDDGTNNCQKCAKTCQTCQGAADTCLICKDASQTPNGSPGKCCVENCATCNNGVCSACKSAFFLSATADCVACDSSCSTCEITAAKCTSCPTGSYLYSDNHCGQCTEAGVFKSDLLCTACDKSCLTCKEKATVCTSCSEKLTLKEGTCVVAEIPPGKITLESAVFQKSTVSISLKFSQVVASIDAGSVRAALYSAKKDDLSLKMTASSPQNYLSELQVPEKTVTVKSVVPTADTLRFDLLIDGEAKDLNLVLAFGKLNAIKSSSEANTAYSPHFAVVEHITVISTNFDQSVAAVQAPAATAVTATTSTLMIASAPQAFVLMKIFQSLDFYVYLNILIPPNFVAFLSILTSNIMEIMPNIFEMFVGDDAASIKDKFSEFGTQVNIFSNIGKLMTTITLAACFKILIASFTWGIRRARHGKRSFLDSINESFSYLIFYGFIESNHLDIILAILVFECEQSRLEMSSTAKILTNVFVGSLIAGLVALYGGMSLFVRRAGKALKEKEKKKKPEAAKLENIGKSNEEEEEKKGGFNFLIRDIQFENGNFFQRYFNLFQLGKDISFAGLLYVAYNSPIGIISLLTGIQIAFIVLVIKYRPFKNKRQNLQLIMSQIIYGLIDVCLFCLAVLPEEGTEKVRYYLFGFSLIGLVLTIFLVSFAFAGFEAFLAIKSVVQHLRGKDKKPLNKVEPSEKVSLNESNVALSASPTPSVKTKVGEDPSASNFDLKLEKAVGPDLNLPPPAIGSPQILVNQSPPKKKVRTIRKKLHAAPN
jgi:hypothetical protein